jgi:hypothetical protein
MNTNIPEYNYFNDLKAKYGYYELLRKWNWEYHVTFSFNKKVSAKVAFIEVKKLLNSCRKGNGFRQMRASAFLSFLISKGNNHHVHALLVSDQKYPNCLSQIDLTKWSAFARMQIYWPFLGFGTIRVKPIHDLTGVCRYVAYENFYPSDITRSDFDIWRPSVLQSLMISANA